MNFRTEKKRPKARERIIKSQLQYDAVAETENYARVKLMLQHPRRQIKSLYTSPDGLIYHTFADPYSNCVNVCTPQSADFFNKHIKQQEVEDLDPVNEPEYPEPVS